MFVGGSVMGDFSKVEMAGRLDRLRREMDREGLDALLSEDGPNIRYATGFRGEPHTLLLTQEAVVLMTSYRTLQWAEEQTEGVELSSCEQPLALVAERLGNGVRLGVDSGISHRRMLDLEDHFGSSCLQTSDAFARVRGIKSAAEIELLHRSQAVNEAVFAAILPALRPGLTERGVQGLILAEMATREEVDGYAFPPIVAAGPNAWEIHHLPDATPLCKDDMIIIDLGVVCGGYASDMTRTVCLGEPSDRMMHVYQCVLSAQEAAFTQLRAGVTNHAADRAARDVLEAAGLARGFTHGLGHAIGLETHDPGVRLSPTAPEEHLKPGMVFTIEPGAYLEGEFGVRTEDIIVVEEGGYRSLTSQDRGLISLAC